MREVHAEDLVARLEQRRVHRDIRLRAGVRLYVCVLRAEELRHALDGQTLDHVHILAPAVVARAGIALGVFIRQVAAHGLHDSLTGKVFGSNQLDVIALALQLQFHGVKQLRIAYLEILVVHGNTPPA